MKNSQEMYKATKEIIKGLDKHDLRYRFKHYEYPDGSMEDHDWITLSFAADNISSIDLQMFVYDDDFIDIKSYICKVDEKKFTSVLKTLNNLNRSHFHIKLFTTNDNEICAETTPYLLASDDNYANRIIDFIFGFASIIDEVYPQIMKSVWGND